MKEYVIAIDLGSGYIKAGLGYNSEGCSEIIAICEVPSMGIRNGLIINTQKASESIKKSIYNLKNMTNFEKFEYLPVVVGINGKNIFSAKSSSGTISIRNNKPIDENDIKKVIEQAKISAVIPSEHEVIYIHPNNFIVDSYKNIKNPIGMFGKRLEVETYVVSVETLMIKNIKTILNNAGISDAQIYLNPIAQKYGILDEEETNENVIIIDIGKNLSTISLWSGDSLVYLGTYEQGLNMTIEEISRDISIPRNLSEEILRTISVPNLYQFDYEDNEIEINDQKRKEVVKVSTRRVVNIVIEILSSIFTKIYSDIEKLGFFKNSSISIIYLSGGVAQIEGISQIVENIFNLPVYIAKPSIKVNDTKFLNPRYITVAGLIKLYFEKPKDRITKGETKENVFLKFFNKLKELIE